MSSSAPSTSTPSLKVGWLELFYDLVYVTVVAAITHQLHGAPSVARMAGCLALLVLVWTVWFNEVQAANLARGISPRNRVFILVSMAGVAVMAIGVQGLFAGELVIFVAGYALARLAMAPVWIDQQRLTGIDATRTVLVGPLVLVAALGAHALGRPGLLWLALALIELAMGIQRPRGRKSRGGRRERRTTAGGQRRLQTPPDEGPHFDSEHLMERIGLFTMICFGEAVAQVVNAMGEHRSSGHWVLSGLGLVLVGVLFWSFYDVALDRVEHALDQAPDRLREVLGFSQIAIVAGILGVAAGLAGTIENGPGRLPASSLHLLAVGTGLAMLGVLSMSMDALRILVTSSDVAVRAPEPTARTRGVLALLLLLNLAETLLAPLVVMVWGAHLPAWLVVALLACGPAVFVLSGSARPSSAGGPEPATAQESLTGEEEP